MKKGSREKELQISDCGMAKEFGVEE